MTIEKMTWGGIMFIHMMLNSMAIHQNDIYLNQYAFYQNAIKQNFM